MDSKPGTVRFSQTASIVTWTIVTGCALWLAFTDDGRLAANGLSAIPVALLNLAAMLLAGRDGGCSTPTSRVALWLQLVTGLGIGIVLPLSFMPIYTIVWIAMAAYVHSRRVMWWLLAAVLLGWFFIMRFVWGDPEALVSVLLYGTFHLFALFSTLNAREAADARDALRSANRELLATQHLLSEAARQGERSRIARDLHDLLGHHLTALSIKLQIAERKSSGAIREDVADSRALARLLLADVREAVSAVRERNEVDVAKAIEMLATDAPGLEVTTDIEVGLAIADVDVAESIVRCVQEAITNSLRHAGASRCSIRIGKQGDAIVLEVSDNGRAPTSIMEGNGIRGMRERLERVRGLLTVDTAEGRMQLRAVIPAGST